ncbi:hypothetical protein SAMN05421823_10869 [Catalinimonas alkaloidigena]|uniref:Uncharacterized protein n=1 Tax=Catalinimonas alkaloidigena TaxID=1075417 RepID=A0A1G9MRU8_9BACT|nr:hypothetical protein [Catalinimonas alkaloidigena]SDL76988.1 hypothetical protein SAMN05421823_10869 [Catalinimonas alkaloidigena]
MRTFLLLFIIAFLKLPVVFAQEDTQVVALLNRLAQADNSKRLNDALQGEEITISKEKLLPAFARRFTDSTLTEVKSDCLGRVLSIGELAIIAADRLEMMPYSQLTGVQNCLLSFCDENPNFIEYYLNVIKEAGTSSFQEKYFEWLQSDGRKEWWPSYDEGRSKQEVRKSGP